MPVPRAEDVAGMQEAAGLVSAATREGKQVTVGPRGSAGTGELRPGLSWEEAGLQGMYEAERAAMARDTWEPEGERATTVPREDALWGRYPAWAEPFQAGQLFREPAAWEEVFKEAGYSCRRYCGGGRGKGTRFISKRGS